MKEDDFKKTEVQLNVAIQLTSSADGGRHTPVIPEENWRPDMYIIKNNRQFWGEIKVTEKIKPGDRGIGKLFAVYPKDLESYFESGSEIKLVQGASLVGSIKIL